MILLNIIFVIFLLVIILAIILAIKTIITMEKLRNYEKKKLNNDNVSSFIT